MPLLLGIIGFILVALLVRMLLIKAPKHGKKFLWYAFIVLVLVAAVGMLLKGLWPVAASLLGGLLLYGGRLLQAFGLWRSFNNIRGKKQRQSTTNDQAAASPSTATMDIATARQILAVDEHASAQDIIQAHKLLIAKNHPDKGGSTFLASQINQAKDTLLAATKR